MPEVYYGPHPNLDPQPDSSGFKQIFTRGPSHDVWVMYQSQGLWQPWAPLDGNTLDYWMVVDRFQGGPTSVFVVDGTDRTLRVRQIPPGGSDGWQSLGAPPLPTFPSPAYAIGHAVQPAGQHLELFAITPQSGLWTRRQQTSGAWDAWQQLALPHGPGVVPAHIAVGRMRPGDLTLFLVDDRGHVWTRTSDGTWTATPTDDAGNDPVVQIGTAIIWPSFDVLVLATTLNGVLKYKVSGDGGLSEWRGIDQSALPAGGVSGIPAFVAGALCARSGDGLWITSTDGTFASDRWTRWQSIGHPDPPTLFGFSMALDSHSQNRDEHPGLQVFASASDRRMWTTKQDHWDAPWSPWMLLAESPPYTHPHPPRPPLPLPIPHPPPIPIGDLPGRKLP